MSFKKKAGVAALASGAVFASLLSPAAHAGTGGSANAGIVFGQDNAYCDAQGVTVTKKDGTSGANLAGAQFSVTPVNANVAVKVYPGAATVAADRVKWQEAFDTALDTSFTESSYGALWLKADFETDLGRAPGAGRDADSTTYRSSEKLVYPTDIRGITDATAQLAAMQSWPDVAADAGNNVNSVSAFAQQVKGRLDALGAVLFTTYNTATPNAVPTAGNAAINATLRGTESEAMVLAEYAKAFKGYTQLKAALAAAGYPSATITATSFTKGAFSSAQSFANFKTAFDELVKADAYSFGLGGATYDVIFKAVGQAAVVAAEAAGDTAAGASKTAVTATSPASGTIYIGAFGRSVTPSGNTMLKTCAHLAVKVEETKAPAGYKLATASQTATPTNTEDASPAALAFVNTLETVSVTPGTPSDTPTFESGV